MSNAIPFGGQLGQVIAQQQMQQRNQPPVQPPMPPRVGPGMMGMQPMAQPPIPMAMPQPLPRVNPQQALPQPQMAQQAQQPQQQPADLSNLGPKTQNFISNLPQPIQAPVAKAANMLESMAHVKKPTSIPDTIHSALQAGAGASGLPYNTLASIAQIESSLNPNAKARTSSASGLFQFINSTWNGMVNKYGDKFGISKGDRMDPRANAIMGGLYLRDNARFLESKLGRQPSASELYTAHFLGPGGAAKILRASDDTPISRVANRAQIRANPTLLRGTVGDFKSRIDNKINRAMDAIGLNNND